MTEFLLFMFMWLLVGTAMAIMWSVNRSDQKRRAAECQKTADKWKSRELDAQSRLREAFESGDMESAEEWAYEADAARREHAFWQGRADGWESGSY